MHLPKSSQRSSGCLQSPNLICKVCLMGRDVCHDWIRLNILPHNSFPAVQTQSENCTTMRRKLSYSYVNKQTLMPVGSLSSLPSSLMQKQKSVQKGIKVEGFCLPLKKIINTTGQTRVEMALHSLWLQEFSLFQGNN